MRANHCLYTDGLRAQDAGGDPALRSHLGLYTSGVLASARISGVGKVDSWAARTAAAVQCALSFADEAPVLMEVAPAVMPLLSQGQPGCCRTAVV